MPKLIASTDTERFLMSLGAAFVEENHILDELLQRIDVDALNDSQQREEEVQSALKEVGVFFFSLNMGFEEEIQSEILEILDVHWGVRDSQSARAMLQDIREQGHRTKFNVLRDALPSEGKIEAATLEKFKQVFLFDFVDPEAIQLSDEDYQKLAEWIQGTRKCLGVSGVLGWDLGRYIHLVRLCYLSGLFSDKDCWQSVAELEGVLASSFSDWMEFSQSFLIGRTFWSGSADPEVKQSCERLMGYPISPWNLLRWPQS